MGNVPCPVHYISLYLIYFILSNLYILTPSPFLPLPPRHSSWVTTSLFSVFVSSFLFCYNCSFVLFFGFHIKVKTDSICLSDSFHFFLSDSYLLLNCGVGEDSWESLGLQGDFRKLVLNIHWKDWCWTETPILWPTDAKNWLIWKDPDAGKDWRQEEKGTTEDEMVGWHHQLDGHEFEQALGVGDEQGSLACCSPWSR